MLRGRQISAGNTLVKLLFRLYGFLKDILATCGQDGEVYIYRFEATETDFKLVQEQVIHPFAVRSSDLVGNSHLLKCFFRLFLSGVLLGTLPVQSSLLHLKVVVSVCGLKMRTWFGQVCITWNSHEFYLFCLNNYELKISLKLFLCIHPC
jgi:hypothetical protein